MGILHLLFFLMAIRFGLRLLTEGIQRIGCGSDYIGLWKVIFVFTILQMSTSLRPILGISDTPLTPEKKFFMQHWSDAARDKLPNRSRLPAPQEAEDLLDDIEY